MRLSHGFVPGETLACLYHGWVYGRSGACQRIPAHPALVPPAGIAAQVWPVIEADGLIWLSEANMPRALEPLPGWSGRRSMPVDCPQDELLAALPGARVGGAWRSSTTCVWCCTAIPTGRSSMP